MTTEGQNQEQDSQQGEGSAEGTQPAPKRRRRRASASTDGAAVDAAPVEDTSAAEAEPTETTAEADSGNVVATEATAEAEAGDAPATGATTEAETGEAPATKKASAEGQPRRTRRSRSESAAAKTTEEVASSDADGGASSEETAPRRRRRSGAAATEDRTETEPQQEKAPPVQRSLPRMLEKLRNEVGPQLMQEFGYTTPMQIPHLDKIVLNIGLGEALLNPKAMEAALRDITAITGQKPLTTRAKKSIAGFKIRDGMAIGVSVTLRGRRMYEFYDRLVSSALPRIRDFQGTSREAFDGRGNYSLGIREQVIFPEIDYNSIDRIRGLQVVIATSARSDIEGLRLLELMGMPFARVRESVTVA